MFCSASGAFQAEHLLDSTLKCHVFAEIHMRWHVSHLNVREPCQCKWHEASHSKVNSQPNRTTNALKYCYKHAPVHWLREPACIFHSRLQCRRHTLKTLRTLRNKHRSKHAPVHWLRVPACTFRLRLRCRRRLGPPCRPCQAPVFCAHVRMCVFLKGALQATQISCLNDVRTCMYPSVYVCKHLVSLWIHIQTCIANSKEAQHTQHTSIFSPKEQREETNTYLHLFTDRDETSAVCLCVDGRQIQSVRVGGPVSVVVVCVVSVNKCGLFLCVHACMCVCMCVLCQSMDAYICVRV